MILLTLINYIKTLKTRGGAFFIAYFRCFRVFQPVFRLKTVMLSNKWPPTAQLRSLG